MTSAANVDFQLSLPNAAPQHLVKRIDGSVQNTVYQTNKRGKPLIRARNLTQINRKMLKHWRGAAKMLDRCAERRQDIEDRVLLGKYRSDICLTSSLLNLIH
jgi:hypothetical protein